MSGLTFDDLVERVSERMHRAMKEARMSKADKKHEDLVSTKMNRFLTQVLVEGRLTVDAAQGELDRLRGMLVSGDASAETIKNGIVVFDGLMQRMALATESFEYPVERNRARDLLVTYARALHR